MRIWLLVLGAVFDETCVFQTTHLKVVLPLTPSLLMRRMYCELFHRT